MECEYTSCSLFILQCNNAVYSCNGVWIRLMFTVYIAVQQCSVFGQWSVNTPYVHCLHLEIVMLSLAPRYAAVSYTKHNFQRPADVCKNWSFSHNEVMCVAVNETPSHSYRMSLAVWNHTVLPATRHKWKHPALTPAKQAGTRFTYLLS